MRSTIEPIYVRSVSPTFSWDDGNYFIQPTNIQPSSQTIDGKQVYIGYAPITQVLLNTQPYDFDIRSSYLVRALDFGDYYNNTSNVLSVSGIASIKFTHSYVMPGLYSVNVSNAEYSNVDSLTWSGVSIEADPALVWTNYTGIEGYTINGQTVLPNVTALITRDTASFLISVVEIPPTAYLSSDIPLIQEHIVFPLTVKITPRFTQTGSFPIEKIVWDLGDGSPLLTKTRWDTNTSLPFVTSGSLSADPLDPRNFDIIHTYTKPDNSVYSFYPSISVYTQSTGTMDVCSITIGPILSQNFDSAQQDFGVLQTELNENGVVVVGHVEDSVGIWKTL